MADEPKKKKQKRLSDFFGSQTAPKPSSKDPSTSGTVVQKPNSDKDGTTKSASTSENVAPKQSSNKGGSTKSALKREFNPSWLEKNPWLQYDNNKMTCSICVSEGKDNPFTSGCTNFRHSTLLRHIDSLQHKAALEAKSLRVGMQRQTLDLISRKNEAVTGAMRCVYWLGKEQLPTVKYKSLLNLHKAQGCAFPDELQAGTATYTSSQAAEEMQDAIASVLQGSTDENLSKSPYISILLDESCDISVTKKLLLYAKTVTDNFDIETHFIENAHIADGKAATILSTVKDILESHSVPFKKVVAIGSDGASVMTGCKNGFVSLVRKFESPFVIGVHCMAHRLALCSSQAADKVSYLKEYQKILSDIFYHFKRSALRREKVKAIQLVLDEPQLQYKELHSVRWFSMYSALETVYRTWSSLATFFETEMVSSNDSASKGFFKKMTSFCFIAVTHLLMDVIPKMTQLSMFLQKETVDLAMIRPTVDSVIQQLTWLKSNDGHYLTEFMAVSSAGKITEFKGVKVTDTPVLRQQFEKVKRSFVTNLITEVERRFPAEATDIVSNMAVLCLRGLSFLSDEDRKEYGASQLEVLTSYFGKIDAQSDSSNVAVEPFIDPNETLLEWDKCKDVVVQQKYPCHTVQSTWKLITANHPGIFPNLTKLAMVAVLAPLQTATVERGFSVQNNIKVMSRNRLSSVRLNTLMQLSLGPDIHNFDFGEAVKKWKLSKERRLFSSKPK